MYLEKKLTLLEIGKILGYSSRSVNLRAVECGIPLRKPGRPSPKISSAKLKYLYLKRRLSSRKIAKMYGCAYSTIDNKIRKLGLPRRTLASAHIKSKRLDFTGDIYERAYLIGFRIGDLRVRKMYKNSETILVDCGSTKPNQILLIKELFGNYGRLWIGQPKNNGKVQIEIGVNESFSFLLPKYSYFPDWTLKNRKAFLSVLAGFIDAEGSFYTTKDEKSASFSLGNYNREILKQIKNKLENEGFKIRLFKAVKKGYVGKEGYRTKQDYWILAINRKGDVLKFCALIMPLIRHEDKVRDIKSVVRNIKARNQKYGLKGAQRVNFIHETKKILPDHNFALR